MSFYQVATDTIMSYTGLSPAAFLTILAIMVVVYNTVCGMFVESDQYDRMVSAQKRRSRDAETAAPPRQDVRKEDVHVGEITEDELREYDGKDESKPLLMAIKSQIFDVSPSRMFYGPGGPYALFAGREASRALALMSFDPQDLNGNLEGLSASELEVLHDWEEKFLEKYRKVGQLVKEKVTCERDTRAENLHLD